MKMKENLGEFEKNEMKASEKVATKKVIEIEEAKRDVNEKRKMAILRIGTRSGLEELEIKRINKIKELKLIPY